MIQLWIKFSGQRFDMIDLVLESIHCVLLVLHLDVQLGSVAEILAAIKLFVHQRGFLNITLVANVMDSILHFVHVPGSGSFIFNPSTNISYHT